MPSSYRICMLMDRYLPVRGGAEVLIAALSEELIRQGHAVTVVTRRIRSGLPAREVIGGVPVLRLAPVGLSHLANALMVFRMGAYLLRHARDYDVIHLNGIGPIGLAALLAGAVTRVPVVITLHAFGNLTRRDHVGIRPSFYSRLMRQIFLPARLWNRILRLGAVYVAISQQILEEGHVLGLQEKMVALPNGVDTTKFRPSAQEEKGRLRQALGLPVDKTLLLFAARLVHLKRPDVALQALPALLERHPDCHLVMAGSGRLQQDSVEDDLHRMVAELELSQHVTFPGMVTNIDQYLQAADVFLFPSAQEGMPVALLEAMATGLPIVASAIDGVIDVMDEDSGWLVPSGDVDALALAVFAALDDPEEATRRGRTARDVVEARYSLSSIAESYANLYARAAGG